MRIILVGAVAVGLTGCAANSPKIDTGASSPPMHVPNVTAKNGYNRITICGGRMLSASLFSPKPFVGLLAGLSKDGWMEPVDIIFGNKNVTIAHNEQITIDYPSNFQLTASQSWPKIKSSLNINNKFKYTSVNVVTKQEFMQHVTYLYFIQSNDQRICSNKQSAGYHTI
jgi:hypothetical protein